MSIEEDRQKSAKRAITADTTLVEVAHTLSALCQLRPEKAEQFMADWLGGWVQRGAYPSYTVGEVSQAAFWELLSRFMSRYIDYLTTEQQAKFVMDNLPSFVAKDNFQRCVSALVEHCSDPESVELLRNAGEAADLLTSSSLRAVLGDIAGPVVSTPWRE